MTNPQEIEKQHDAADSSAERDFGRGFLWFVLARSVGVLTSLVTLAVLSRLLTPYEFGQIAIVASVLIFAIVCLEALVISSIVQRAEGPPKFRAAIAGLGIVVAIIWAFAQATVLATMLEKVLAIDGLANLIAAASVVVILKALSAPQMASLQREHKFAAIARVLILSNILGYALPAIAFAANGFGAWSIVFGLALSAALEVLFLWFAQSAREYPVWDLAAARPAIAFGSFAAASRAAAWIASNIDTYIVAYFLGTVALGFYSRSYNFFVQIKELFDMPIRRALTPVLSTIQNDVATVARTIVNLLRIYLALSAAIAVFIWISALEIVLLLLGPNWLEVVPVIQLLFLGLPARVGFLVLEACTTALGSGFALFYRQFFQAVAIGLSCWFGSKYGIQGVAIGVAIGYCATYLLTAADLLARLHVGFGQFIILHTPAVVISGVLFAILFALDQVTANVNYILRFFLLGGVWFLLVVLGFLFGPGGWMGATLLERRKFLRDQGARLLFNR